jgi:hypothetical protein
MVTDGEKPRPIDPRELPPFLYRPLNLADVLPGAILDMGLLALACSLLFGASMAAFTRYDVR